MRFYLYFFKLSIIEFRIPNTVVRALSLDESRLIYMLQKSAEMLSAISKMSETAARRF